MSRGHWSEGCIPKPDEYIGFIYCITNRFNGRKYLGRKNYWFTRRVKVAGRKNRRKVVKESDWKTYTGSSKELNQDIAKHGIDNFAFRILSQHKYMSALKYAEVEQIIKRNALRAVMDDGVTYTYYNGTAEALRCRPKGE